MVHRSSSTSVLSESFDGSVTILAKLRLSTGCFATGKICHRKAIFKTQEQWEGPNRAREVDRLHPYVKKIVATREVLARVGHVNMRRAFLAMRTCVHVCTRACACVRMRPMPCVKGNGREMRDGGLNAGVRACARACSERARERATERVRLILHAPVRPPARPSVHRCVRARTRVCAGPPSDGGAPTAQLGGNAPRGHFGSGATEGRPSNAGRT